MARLPVNGNGRWREGEAMGRLIALNEEIRDYNRVQTETMTRLLETMSAHSAENRKDHDVIIKILAAVIFTVLALLAAAMNWKFQIPAL